MNLNFGFAKVQLDRGNACGAIGILERILLMMQNLPEVRMMYAIVTRTG
ncbi:MAG: hypothetical protein OSB46_07815 [Alphaproteobacteria bacterium]|nr:hypothetical protein [Alphaproteobacteria bacterium]